jgi:hypothetical protein
MTHSRIFTLLMLAGSAAAFTGCTTDSTTADSSSSADSKPTTSVASGNGGWYDGAGAWHPGRPEEWYKDGYYDNSGVWHAQKSREYSTAGAKNLADENARQIKSNAERGWYDSNGAWHSGTSYRVEARDTRDGYYDKEGVWHSKAVGTYVERPDRDANGYYDSNGVWRTRIEDSSTTVSRADAGYYDSNGVWHAPDGAVASSSVNRTDPSTNQIGEGSKAGGYCDSNGNWQPGSGGVSRIEPGPSGGYYDSNGVWRSYDRSLTQANRGYYDNNGNWHPNSYDRSTGVSRGYYDANGVWQPGEGVRVVDGNPNISTGYYDASGVWHSVGAPGVVNIPIGTSDQRMYARASDDRSVQGYAQERRTYEDETRAGEPRRENTVKRDTTTTTTNEAWSSWPSNPRSQVQTLTSKYGAPDEATASCVSWHDKGGFKCIVVMKEEVDHQWPVAHTDFLMNAVSYKVPVDKVGALARFDGSVMTDVTGGVLAAKCDSEAHNMLALNLANDICTGAKTVDEAKAYFSRAVADEKAGKTDPYMQKLAFTPASGKSGANPGAAGDAGNKSTDSPMDRAN